MTTPSISTSQLYSSLELLLESDIPVFIHGSPGIGKSYIVADIAEKRGLELIDIRLSQMDPVDLRGVPSISDNQTVWMPPVFFPKDKNSQGILFLDELNSASPSVQAAIYQLVLDRKMGEYSLPEKWRIVCAGNKISDRGVVFKLPTPLANRMVHLPLKAHFDDFKTFAIGVGMHHFIIGFLSFRPDLLATEAIIEDDANPAFATPRSYHMLSTILKNSGDVSALHSIINGTIGYSAGIEFASYIKVYENIPDVQAIFSGHFPTLSPEPALLYALVSALVEYYDKEKGHQKYLFDFSKLLPTEFSVMLIKDIIVKDESLAEDSGFEKWLEKYGEYIL